MKNFTRILIAGASGIIVSRYLLHLNKFQEILVFMGVFITISIGLHFVTKKSE